MVERIHMLQWLRMRDFTYVHHLRCCESILFLQTALCWKPQAQVGQLCETNVSQADTWHRIRNLSFRDNRNFPDNDFRVQRRRLMSLPVFLSWFLPVYTWYLSKWFVSDTAVIVSRMTNWMRPIIGYNSDSRECEHTCVYEWADMWYILHKIIAVNSWNFEHSSSFKRQAAIIIEHGNT